MSRSPTTVALLASLLLVLQATGAVANVAMDPGPPIQVACSPYEATPGVLVFMAASQETDLTYTVSDKDTFTPGPPQPPPGPYNGPCDHVDNICITNYTNVDGGTWFHATATPYPGEWTTQGTYTAHLCSFNDTGYPQTAYFGLFWNDRADGPMGIPPEQVTGNANDASYGFQKQVEISP